MCWWRFEFPARVHPVKSVVCVVTYLDVASLDLPLLAEGVAESFVCLWQRPYMLQRVNSSTVPRLVGAVLDLLDTDRLPQGAGEKGVVS